MFILLPYGNDRPTLRFPVVTYALLATNILVYLWMLPLDESTFQAVLDSMGLIPSEPSVVNTITSMFLHTGFIHIAWNMLFLWLFGRNVEDALGHLEYAIFYFGSGFAAALLHVLVIQGFIPQVGDIPMVGASGAIAGILGVFAIRFYKTRIRIFYGGTFTMPASIALGIWFVQQFIWGVFGIIEPQTGGVAYWSHIGGMVFGMILAVALKMGVEGTKEYLMTNAKTSLERGTTWGATENLRTLLKRDPENAHVHREMGRTYALQQNSTQAIAHYRKSIEIYLRNGERDQALESYAQLVDYYPDSRLSLRSEYQLANYLLESQDCVEALTLLEGIFVTYPETPEAEMSLMKAGTCLKDLGKCDEAIRYYERFLHQYPHSSYHAVVEKKLSETRRAVDPQSDRSAND